MSFLKKLFGGGGAGAPPAPNPTQEYRGYVITAHPAAEGSDHRVSGTIAREVDGERREKRFDRADRMGSRDEAVELSFQKARTMIDQMGDRLFD